MDTRLIRLNVERHCESKVFYQERLTSYKLVNDYHMFQTLGIHSTSVRKAGALGMVATTLPKAQGGRKGLKRPPLGLTPRLTPILAPALTLNPGLDHTVNTEDTVNTGIIDMVAALQTRSR